MREESESSSLRERQLEVLALLARIATEDLELRPMLQRVVDALAEMLDWEHVGLVRIDHERQRFVCEALVSRVPTEVFVGYSRPFGSGVVGHVAATGEPLLLDDTTAFPDFVDTLHGARSELCVPIRHRGEVVAMLNVESPRPAAFHGQLALVEAIAGQIAGAIASARRHDEVRQRVTTFTMLSEVTRAALEVDDLDQVLARIADYLQRRLDLFLVAIVVADEKGLEWSHRAFASRAPIEIRGRPRWPIERGVVGRAIRTGQTQLVLDVAGDPDYFAVNDAVRAELVVPIRHGGRILGALNIESDRTDSFDEEMREAIELVAAQVAGAIGFAFQTRVLSATKNELEAANRRLEELSMLDPLTGIANRRRFDSELGLEWRRLTRSRGPLALLLVDVDCFKAYNDTLGHPAGDRCLRRVAEALQSAVHRAGDLLARYGGEEFAVLLGEADPDTARSVAERLREEVESAALPHPASRVAATVTVSIGGAVMTPRRSESPLALVSAADAALYRAKGAGRNRVVVGDTAHEPGPAAVKE